MASLVVDDGDVDVGDSNDGDDADGGNDGGRMMVAATTSNADLLRLLFYSK